MEIHRQKYKEKMNVPKYFHVTVIWGFHTIGTAPKILLICCSSADDYLPQMNAKIRHFYDLHHSLQDADCQIYLQSNDFRNDFQKCLDHDRQSFVKPDGLQTRPLSKSPLMKDVHATWQLLQPTYLRELPDLSYSDIPYVDEVETRIQLLLTYI